MFNEDNLAGAILLWFFGGIACAVIGIWVIYELFNHLTVGWN